MRYSLPLLVLLALLGAGGSPARAWWSSGHMAVAAIAYDHLTPRTRAAVDALLARHKGYSEWMAALPPGYRDRPRYAFLRASAWPDDVRRTPDDRPLWHYVDLPVIAPGYKPDPAAVAPVVPNAVTQLSAEAALLGDRRAADGDRAVALCWVEHLVGDMHQPLHDASLFSARFPRGDRGGNSDLVTATDVASDPVEAADHPKNLHAVWDGLFGDTDDPAAADRTAARLEAPAFARRTFPQITRDRTATSWAAEGNALAREDAYLNGALRLTPDGDRADAALPAGYLAKAHAVADRQVALAGLRLADMLNAVKFPPVSTAPLAALPKTPAAAAAAGQGAIIGNRRSHVYHLPGGTGQLPAETNRVYFQTEDAAKKAGYHAPGTETK